MIGNSLAKQMAVCYSARISYVGSVNRAQIAPASIAERGGVE
jgi:hypothetical protein